MLLDSEYIARLFSYLLLKYTSFQSCIIDTLSATRPASPTHTGSGSEDACVALLLVGHFQHLGVQFWADQRGKQHSTLAGRGSSSLSPDKSHQRGLGCSQYSPSKCQTFCIKDRKHLEKLLTCSSCFNAQGFLRTALPTCVPADTRYQGTAPKHSTVSKPG